MVRVPDDDLELGWRVVNHFQTQRRLAWWLKWTYYRLSRWGY